MKKRSVCVLFGGISPEHDVSLRSAESVLNNMDSEKYNILPVGITKKGEWILFGGDDYSQLPEGTWKEHPDNRRAAISPVRGQGLLIFEDDCVVEQNVDVVLHDLPHRSDTVRLGLEALGDLDACMFVPGDQPLLRRETVAKLLQARQESPHSIIRPIHEDTQGSPVLFPAWTFPELRNLPEGKGGGVVIQNHPHDILCVSVSDPFELADADTPETLELLKGFYHD